MVRTPSRGGGYLRGYFPYGAGFELDRNALERRSGSLFKDRNGVPVHFLEIPNEIQIAFVAWISLLPFLAILKLRLSSVLGYWRLLLYYNRGFYIGHVSAYA